MAKKRKFIDTMAPFVGANMAFKRDCFKKIGFFETNIGPGQGTRGEDTELFHRLRKKEMSLYYCGA